MSTVNQQPIHTPPRRHGVVCTLGLLTLLVIGEGVMLFSSITTYSLIADSVVSIRSFSIPVEIAKNPTTRAKGLSGRSSILPGHGMLFVFEQSGRHPFWMKNMFFPLDLLWIDSRGTVIDITENVPPESFPTQFQSVLPVRFVLEIPAGFVATHAIQRGDHASLPMGL